MNLLATFRQRKEKRKREMRKPSRKLSKRRYRIECSIGWLRQFRKFRIPYLSVCWFLAIRSFAEYLGTFRSVSKKG